MARSILAVLVLGAVAALAFTHPLAGHVTRAIPYATAAPPERRLVELAPGDHLQFYYFLAITEDMVRGRVPFFRDPYQFSAPAPDPRPNFFFLPFTLLFAAVAPIIGGAAAYNLILWLSFPATALAVFLLGRRLGLADLPAGVAAAGATLLPWRVGNVAGGHPSGVVLFLVPLTFFFLERGWQERSRGSAAAAAVSVAVLAVNEPQLLYFLHLLLPFWVLWAFWRLAPAEAPAWSGATVGRLAVAAVGPAVAFAGHWRRGGSEWPVAAFVTQYLAFVAVTVLVWRLAGEIRARAGNPGWEDEARALLPLALLAAYPLGPALRIPYFGRALVALVLAAIVVRERRLGSALGRLAADSRFRDGARRLVVLWPFALGVVAAVGVALAYKTSTLDVSAMAASARPLREVKLFSPGPADLLRRDNPVLTRHLYPGIAVLALALLALAGRRGRAVVGVGVVFTVLALGLGAEPWLPLYRAGFELVPLFDRIRQTAKFFAVGGLALALAAGFGLEWLRERAGARAAAATALVALVAIVADFSVVLPLGLSFFPAHNRVYAAVAEQGRGTNLLELPIWPGDSAYSSLYQYWATRTRIAVVNGYSPTVTRDYLERVARPLETMNLGELGAEQHALLDRLNVRLVTLHRDAFPPKVSAYPYRFTLAAMRADPNLEPVADDSGVYLFRRREGSYREWDGRIGSPLGIFYEAEDLRSGSGERREDRDASGGVLVRGADRARPLVYGPYRPFPRGRYEARFRSRGAGRVEVTTDLGATALVSGTVASGDLAEHPLRFELDRPRTLELRAWSEGSSFDVDWVLVRKLDPIPGRPPGRFEAEDLPARSGLAREIEGASGNAAAVVVPEAAPPGSLVLDGPWRIFNRGRLRAAVRSRGGEVRVRIESADGRRRLGEIVAPRSAEWRTTQVEIEADRRDVVCARVISSGAAAEVDFVELGRER